MTELVDLALAAIGASGSEYVALVAPEESPGAAASMGRASGCGLVVRVLLRQYLDANGVQIPPCLRAPYKNGTIMTLLLDLAYRAHAVGFANEEPQPGDVIWLSNPDHVEIYLGGGWRCAGGQRDASGAETVLCVSRGPAECDAPTEPSRVLEPREVVRLIRWEALGPYLLGGGQ